MPFASLTFLGFTAAAVVAYYLVPRNYRWCILLAASYLFYMAGGWHAVFYIIFTTAVTYIAGRLLNSINKVLYRKIIVAISLILCLGLLFMLRYLDFAQNLIIPLGISFYIFQSIGYVIDVYRGKHGPEANIGKFALFISFFPQIIQGPISRFNQLAPQLEEGNNLDLQNIKYGIQLAMWGYFKMLVIAGRAGMIVDAVYGNFADYDGAVIAFAVLLFGIQLYCDFSGGIDITRGVAKMFGINMVDNFRRPIFSTSLAEFWRRWHITLGTWLKDYLFFSLALSKPIVKIGMFTRHRIGGTLGKIIPTSLCTFAVYFAVGIWHGASFRYIAFGIWNGVIITSSLLLAGFYTDIKKRLRINDKSFLWWVFCVFRTGALVSVGWYLVRAPRFVYGVNMLRRTFTHFRPRSLLDGTLLNFGLTWVDLAIIFIAMAVVVALEFYQEKGGEVRKSLESKNFLVQWAAIFMPLAAIIFLGMWGYTEVTLYGQ